MLKTILPGLVAALCAATAALPQEAAAAPSLPTLGVGDLAPPLIGARWLKGDPVTTFGDGNVYVLDFWATWSGPSIRSIPHLNRLAQSRRDDGVEVIGVAIWPTETMTPTAGYVEGQGDQMDYRIAEDLDGTTAAAFVTATGQTSIPTAMVVDRSGRLVWIGHPMDGLEVAVGQVVDGSFDLAAEQARQAKVNATRALAAALGEAEKTGSWEDVARLSNEIVALGPDFESYHVTRYRALVHLGRVEEARALGMRLAREDYHDDSAALNQLAWTIVDPAHELLPEQRDLRLAFVAALRADELTGHKHPGILDTVARAYAWQGDLVRAIDVQQQAVELAEGRMRDSLAATLEEYRRQLQG